jgi:hypothetical protein
VNSLDKNAKPETDSTSTMSFYAPKLLKIIKIKYINANCFRFAPFCTSMIELIQQRVITFPLERGVVQHERFRLYVFTAKLALPITEGGYGK